VFVDQISVGFCVFDHSEVSDNNVSDDVIVDLLTGGLLPSSLKRERSPCVRSLSWSEIGMSPNHGYCISCNMFSFVLFLYFLNS